jgi:hypothetical protein
MNGGRSVSGMLAVLLVSLGASQARATTELTNGAVCVPAAGSTVSYNQFGVFNASSSTIASVFCAPQHTQSSTPITAISLGVYDRHFPSGPILCCAVTVTDFLGNTAWTSGNKCSFSTNFNNFQFFPPSGTDGFVSVNCALPPITGNGVSHLTSILVSH